MRSTLTAAIITIIARSYSKGVANCEVRCPEIDLHEDDPYAAECYSDSQKPAPHFHTRRQYKTLVLPRRSRKSKRR